MGVRMKNFNTIGVHWEIKFLRAISQKTVIYRGELSKEGGLGQCADLRGTFQKRGGSVFDGWLIPQCTLWDIIGHLGSNLIFRCWPKFFKFVDIWCLKEFLVLTLTETSFATTSYSFNCFFSGL